MADVYRIEVTNATATASALDRTGQRLRMNLVGQFRAGARQVEAIFREEAPVASGRLREATRARVSFTGDGARITMESGARNPRDGFNYLAVTRFGHRKTIITPRTATGLAVHYDDQRPNKIAFVREASGVRHATDWVGVAARRANPIVTGISRRLGESIDRGML